MKILKILSKKIFIFISAITVILLIFIFNLQNLRSFLSKNISSENKDYIYKFIFGEELARLNFFTRGLRHNLKILPDTQFNKFMVTYSPQLPFSYSQESYYDLMRNTKTKTKKFFINEYYDNFLIVSSNGEILKSNDLKKFKKIESNLKDLKLVDLKDAEIIEKEMYVSFSKKNKIDCYTMHVFRAKIDDLSFFKFQKLFSIDDCIHNLVAGRIHKYIKNGEKGLLLTTGDDGYKGNYAQSEKSLYGKILFYNLKSKIVSIISKGHRNPQGLVVANDKILSTEHGPQGGDEINLILEKKNYGWPVASVGEPYNFNNTNKNFYYEKNHKKLNFYEPIFSFVPSIGISEIIEIPKNFSKKWVDNFLVASLNGKSIFRIQFDKDFKKINFLERIFIGERVRDLVYSKKLNAILVSLENSGRIMTLKEIHGN